MRWQKGKRKKRRRRVSYPASTISNNSRRRFDDVCLEHRDVYSYFHTLVNVHTRQFEIVLPGIRYLTESRSKRTTTIFSPNFWTAESMSPPMVMLGSFTNGCSRSTRSRR